MVMVDRWVVDRAIELLEGCLRRGGRLPLLAVNLSGTSINDEDFLDFVMTRLGNEQVARALCFEITETAAVASLAKATFFMRELKARGCRFALDDFGSGVSSFVYLKTLPVDFLKIDGQFAAHVVSDPVDRSMVEAIAKIGRAMQVATIAREGGERRRARRAARTSGSTTSRDSISLSPAESTRSSAERIDRSNWGAYSAS